MMTKNEAYADFCAGADATLSICFGTDERNHTGKQLTKDAQTHWRGTLGWFFQCHYNDLYRLCDEFGANWKQLGHLFVLTVNGHGCGFWDLIEFKYTPKDKLKLKRITNRLCKACKQYNEISCFITKGRRVDFEFPLLDRNTVYYKTGVLPKGK